MNIFKQVGLAGILTVVFIGLKLTSQIDWSWFWVLSPLLFVFFASFVYSFVRSFLKEFKRVYRERRK